MSENIYFQKALARMTAGAAYVDAIRHMHDSGMSAEEIQKNLSYPVSIEKVERAIRDYEVEKTNPEGVYKYVEKVNEYGKRSFLRVKDEK